MDFKRVKIEMIKILRNCFVGFVDFLGSREGFTYFLFARKICNGNARHVFKSAYPRERERERRRKIAQFLCKCDTSLEKSSRVLPENKKREFTVCNYTYLDIVELNFKTRGIFLLPGCSWQLPLICTNQVFVSLEPGVEETSIHPYDHFSHMHPPRNYIPSPLSPCESSLQWPDGGGAEARPRGNSVRTRAFRQDR